MTTADPSPRFSAEEVIDIAARLSIAADEMILIGGQAANLWAYYYKTRDPRLQAFKDPLTSRDIDYFGTSAAAQAFAAVIGGEVIAPPIDDMNTPNSAVVKASWNGKELVVDFMHGILGVENNDLQKKKTLFEIPCKVDGKSAVARITVMHPVHCLMSRVANMVAPTLRRSDSFAWAQLRAALIVIERHIEEALAGGDQQETKLCLRALFGYLRYDRYGKHADLDPGVDILSVLKVFENDRASSSATGLFS
jgi:hypothetical protein